MGTVTKGKETIRDNCSHLGKRLWRSEDEEEETVFNFFRSVGMN